MEGCTKFRYDYKGYQGTPKRYFHFLWGYVFPAIHHIRQYPSDDLYWFESCGPSIDPILEEILQQLGIHAKIAGLEEFEVQQGKSYLVPRWDVLLFKRVTFSLDMVFSPHYTINLKHYVLRTMLLNAIVPQKVKAWKQFKKDIRSIKAYMLAQFQIEPVHTLSEMTSYLVIERTVVPGEQAQAGVKRPLYAPSLRALDAVPEAIERLQQAGIPARAYAPGAHSFRHQMQTYQQCKGVVAMRGSDLANLIWLPPGAKVVVIKPRHASVWSKPTYYLFALAELFDLKVVELSTTVEDYPSLLDFDLIPYLK